MIEDTPDKIRRNLVTFSSALIAVWLFNPTVSKSINLLGIGTIDGISVTKAWSCALAVLLYLFLRYRFDLTASAELKSLGDEHRLIYQRTVNAGLRRRVESYLQTTQPGMFTPMMFDVEDSIKGVLRQVGNGNGKIDTFDISHTGKLGWRGNGLTSIHVIGTMGTGQAVSQSIDGRYQFPWHIAPFIVVWPLMRTSFYTKSSVDVLAPIFLSFFALLVCGSKIFNSVLL